MINLIDSTLIKLLLITKVTQRLYLQHLKVPSLKRKAQGQL